MSTPQKQLKAEAKKFIDVKKLFPKKPPDFRRKLSKYQVKKIRQSIEEVKLFGGGKVGQFVPMGKGRARYMKDNGLPPWLKGIFLSGGDKINKNLRYENHEIKYERGGAPRSRRELDTSGDEEDLLASADKILKARNRRTAALTANGYVISGAQNLRSNDLIKREAVYIFLKYSEMADSGEMRKHNGALTKAAHPSEWGMGILFEQGRSSVEKEKSRDKFSKAWKSKHKGKK